MRTSKLTAATLTGVLIGALTLLGPATGFARDDHRSATVVKAGYRDHGEHRDRDRYRYRDDYRRRDYDRHHHRHDHRHRYGPPRGHAYGHHRPYYRDHYYRPRYYDHGDGHWSIDLRYFLHD